MKFVTTLFAAAAVVGSSLTFAADEPVEKYEHADWAGVSFGTRQVINASPQTIWAILKDISKYPEWNVFTPQVKTTFVVGSSIEFKVRLFRALPKALIDQKEVVTNFDENASMCWASNIISDANFNTYRCLNIDINEFGQTVFSNTMRYEGFSWPMLYAFSSGSVKDGFEDLSNALKARAEAAENN